MDILKGALVLGQSGGPTAVINASAAGVFIEALKNKNITRVYGASHGIKGILNEELYDINQEDIKELELLKTTPASSIGSVRYKLKDIFEDDTEYKRILEVFKKYDIRYFIYNGGNDSMDTCNKISKFFKDNDYKCICVGIPKTIDNDLAITDHTPGFPSVAKYVATSIMELKCDAFVYDTPIISIFEAMGRNAGFIAASAILAKYMGYGADLIYLPEITFDFDKFWLDVKKKIESNNGKVIIVVSEGVKLKDGSYVSDSLKRGDKDSFGHAQMGGTASVLADFLRTKTKIKVRSIEPALLQRCAAHIASKVDIDEAYNAGVMAIKYASEGYTDFMVGFKRVMNDNIYSIEYIKIPLEDVANLEKKFPKEWIINDGTDVSDKYLDYLFPLIEGEMEAPKIHGLRRFANLKKILVSK